VILVISLVLGFIVLSRYQQNGEPLGVWAAICRGLGIAPDVQPASAPQPPLRTATLVAWTGGTLDQIAAGNAEDGAFVVRLVRAVAGNVRCSRRAAFTGCSGTHHSLAVKHALLREQYERRSKLTPGYSITVENLDNARRQSESAAASYQQAIASRDTATLNLNRTEVRAPVNGFITNLNLANGTYASQGKPVMALIDSDSYRIEAYFEETKIPHIRAGASADIYLMDGSPALQGTVSSIARGITDQDNKDGPQLLSSVNPTFTWVRLAQRIPVTVHVTHVPPGVLVSAGMTCTVVMKEGAAPEIGLSLKKAVAAIFGAPSG
jgi:HlyD family secretion protein